MAKVNRTQYLMIVILVVSMLLLVFMFFLMYLNNKIKIQEHIREYNIETTKYNVRQILELYYDKSTNLTIKDMIVYKAITGNDMFSGINITKIILDEFYRLYGNRWKIEVYYIPIVKAWFARAYFDKLNLWNWDTSIYPDIKDNNGYTWYQPEFNDSSWSIITTPLYQGDIVERMLGINLGRCKELHSIIPSIPKGVYYCENTRINPFQLYSKFEACTWRGDTDHPKIGVTNNLPKDIDYLTFGYLVMDGSKCDIPGKSQEVKDAVYKKIIYYNTISKIDEIAKNQGVQSDYFVTYFRGKFKVPNYCKDVYLEALWNEMLRLYVNGEFLFANCYNSNINPPKWKLDNVYCSPLPSKPCLKGIPTWGIVRVNITDYVRKNGNNVVAMLFGVPHTSSSNPSCYPDMNIYYDLDINTIGAVRIFCLDKNRNLYELNQETALPPILIYSLGYTPPNNTKNIYTLVLPYYVDVNKLDIQNSIKDSYKVVYIKIEVW